MTEPEDIEAALVARLRQDAALRELLAPSPIHDDGTPGVWEAWAPEQQQEPYVTMQGDYAPAGSPWALRTGTVDVHIWDRGPGYGNARKIRDAVLQALDRRTLTSEQTGHSLRVYAGADAPVSDDQPGQVHWLQALDVRYWRQADLEAMTDE